MGCGSTKDRNEVTDPASLPVVTSQIDSGISQKANLPPVKDINSIRIRNENFVTEKRGLLTDHYQIGKSIGDGAFGKVREGRQKATKEVRAVKTINKGKTTSNKQEQARFRNEVQILAQMDHPNILRVFEFFEDKRHFHLVTENCKGGELFDYIVEHRKLTESLAADVMLQLLSSIAHCHEKNVAHRDLKPENLLLLMKPTDKNPKLQIKVIDFGTSCLFDPRTKLRAKYGTPYYIAPEVLNQEYDNRCDTWSAGVIMYIMLCGYPPFSGKSDDEILNKVKKMQYSFPEREWRQISSEAKDLISRMLLPQAKRPYIADLLNDPWIVKNHSQNSADSQVGLLAFENLTSFRAERKLQQAVLGFVTSQLMRQDDLNELATTFQAFDQNGDGKLSREELLEGYSQLIGSEAAEEEVQKIMDTVDTDQSGFVDYSEFIAAAANKHKILSKDNLQNAFDAFDTDGNGSISVDEIKSMLGGMTSGKDDVWEQIISEVDQDGNGEIDIKEFKEMMVRLF